jgi:hypothetical protein
MVAGNDTPVMPTTVFLPSATASATGEILPTRTLDLFRPGTVRETYGVEGTQ